MNKFLLFISNGMGEDAIAVSILKKLREKVPSLQIRAFPLVGEGKMYAPDAEILGPRTIMPSGGLIPESWRNILLDLKSGLWKLTLQQIGTLKALRGKISLSVSVGDAIPVIMGGLFLRRPLIFVGTAKSNYFSPYSSKEKILFKKYCKMVFPRDEPTAESLRRADVPASWVGNAMMDSLVITGRNFGLQPDQTAVGILPGSRKEAYGDLPVLLSAVEALTQAHQGKLLYLMALASTLDVSKLTQLALDLGWRVSEEDLEPGMDSFLLKGESRVLLIKAGFGDVINTARVVLGQAGTGNEQSVGLGKPVVAFDSGGGEKMGWYRARQKALLGSALSVVEKDPIKIADEIVAILSDQDKYLQMSQAGLERMGPPGAARHIADYILETLDKI